MLGADVKQACSSHCYSTRRKVVRVSLPLCHKDPGATLELTGGVSENPFLIFGYIV